MKRLGSGRIEALALSIVDRIARTPGVEIRDRGAAVRVVATRLSRAFQVDASADRTVRARIASLSRAVPEGSREWDVLYRQYLEEILRKR